MSEKSPEELSFPVNWDRLSETVSDEESHSSSPSQSPGEHSDGPPIINLVAATLADLVAILAFIVAELLAVRMASYKIGWPALPWVITLALAWWCVASLMLVVVRRGTPGMLMAGVVFKHPVPPTRLAVILLADLALICLLGLPALLGPDRSPLRFAGGSPLSSIGEPDQ
jgi:hypothetical protein